MHQAQAQLERIALRTKPSPLISHTLNAAEASTLTECLLLDARSYVYSAAVSVADAIHGMRRQLISWATVKLYYSVYYGCRGILALNKVGVFYEGSKPCVIEASPGAAILRRKGQTHKIVLREFEQRNLEPSLISQDIELYRPLDWLMDKRETANYRNSRFWEPDLPAHFSKVFDIGLRRAIAAYVADLDTYAFDPEHAMVAYAIKALHVAYNRLSAKGRPWDDVERAYVMGLFVDDMGPIPELRRLFD